MNYLDDDIKKLKKQVDENFRIMTSDGRSYINKSCSTGRKVTVDYFILKDLLEFYDQTKEAANAVIIAREALKRTYWDKIPLDEKT